MTRAEQNAFECQHEDGFDWEQYQTLCDIADYWDADE